MNERKRLWFVNWPLLVVVALLLVFGSLMVHSATAFLAAGAALFRRQLLGIVLGLIALVAAWAFDYRRLSAYVGPLILLDALLIISPRIPGIGATAKGATSWLAIGGFRLFQPSEPAKLVTIVLLAAVIAQYKGVLEKPRDVARVVGIIALVLGLILLQPDLGTGMVFIAIGAGMLLIGGLKGRWFAILGFSSVLLIAALFMTNVAVKSLTGRDVVFKQYQIDRLMVFVDPNRDPGGAGYNLEQSKIAVGSGQLTGTGLRAVNTQSTLRFLPEPHTDFIFSVTGEELGFLGALALLALYLALLVTSLEISAQSRDLFGSLIVAGVISMWTFQILENIGMTLGLMPITGIPLPFMSFGSSFMITNLAAVGMLLSVWTRRQGIPGY